MPSAKYARSLTTSPERHYSVTPNDSTDLNPIPRALFIGGAGDVVLRDRNGDDVTYTVPAGSILPFRAVRVLATGTDASMNIVAWL